MLQSKFLMNKIKRQIKINGQIFSFKRYKIDQYHQVSDEIEKKFNIEGLYHTTNVYIKTADAGTKEASIVVRKQQPMILCLFEDGKNVEINDTVSINDDVYVVVNKNNINEFNVAFDISLEMKV